jgi:hypothetical protein
MRSEVVRKLYYELHSCESKEEKFNSSVVEEQNDSLLWCSSISSNAVLNQVRDNFPNSKPLNLKKRKNIDCVGTVEIEQPNNIVSIDSPSNIDYTHQKGGILKSGTPISGASFLWEKDAAFTLLLLATETNKCPQKITTTSTVVETSNFYDDMQIVRIISNGIVGVAFRSCLLGKSKFVTSLLNFLGVAKSSMFWKPVKPNTLCFISFDSIYNTDLLSSVKIGDSHTTPDNCGHSLLSVMIAVKLNEIELVSCTDTIVKHVSSITNDQRRPLLVQIKNILGIMFPVEQFDAHKFPASVMIKPYAVYLFLSFSNWCFCQWIFVHYKVLVNDKVLKGTYLHPQWPIKVYNVVGDPNDVTKCVIDPRITFLNTTAFKNSSLKANLTNLMLELDSKCKNNAQKMNPKFK